MKVEFPNYYNNILYENNNITIEIKEDEYFKSIDDLKIYLELFDMYSLNKCDEIITEIENSLTNKTEGGFAKKIINFLRKNDKYNKWIKNVIHSLPNEIKSNYHQQAKDLIQLNMENLRKSTLFIIENKEEIYKMLDELKQNELDKLRSIWRVASNKYYKKKKELLGIPDKVKMSDDERKLKRIESNKKYYLKKKQLKDTELV